MDTKRVAVIMTVFNRKSTTLECLGRLKEQILKNTKLDVYLTDDGSTDGTSLAVKEKYPEVEIIEGDGNLFWNRGMLAAWKKAKDHNYDFYLWLNDDTILYNDAIQRLLKTSTEHNDKAVIVGPTCSSINSSELTYGGVDYNGKRMDVAAAPMECYTFNGNIVLIPRHVYEIVGMNDPIYHHGAGDYDYGIRVIKHGLKNIISPGFYGVCNRHDNNFCKWNNPNNSILTRLRALFSVSSGANPRDVIIYNYRYKGFFEAFCISLMYLKRALLPKKY